MRHRIKKIPTLSKLNHKLNHHLLHSDKSDKDTYFYKGKVKGFSRFFCRFASRSTNDIQWTSPHCEQSDTNTDANYANRTRSSRETTSYSGIGSQTLSSHMLYSTVAERASSSTIPLVLSSIALLLVLGLMISPSIVMGEGILGSIEQASAIEQDFGAGRTVSLSIINNGTTLADGDTVSTNVETPGTVSYIDNTIRINTNKIAKYYVGVQAASDGSSDLIGSQYGETIAGVGNNVSPDNFGDNTWGYSLTDNTSIASSALTYNTLPVYNTNSPLQYTSTTNPADGNHDLKLTFAAKINANKPGDHYQTKAMVSVAADAKTMTLSEISYMQDMMPDICSASTEHETKQLIDKRDHKSYWVTKLKDGNCWMTQNLDLDIPASGLKASDTDITTDWTPYVADENNNGAVATIPNGQLTTENWPAGTTESNRLVRSYDPGEYVYTGGTDINPCGTNQSSLANCTGWESYTGKTASGDPNFGNATTSTNYNGHYTAGNYYNYNAVTAGTGLEVSTNNADASGSICPKGWQLPYAGRNKFNNNYQSPEAKDPNNNIPIERNKSFINLLEAYGWGPGTNNKMWVERDSYGNPRAPLSASSYNIAGTPLHLLRGGLVYSVSLINTGSNGYYWSSTAQSVSSAYNLYFDSPDVGPSDNYGRFRGFSVRCVAR